MRAGAIERQASPHDNYQSWALRSGNNSEIGKLPFDKGGLVRDEMIKVVEGYLEGLRKKDLSGCVCS